MPWLHPHPPPNPVQPAAKSNNPHPNIAYEPSPTPPIGTTIMAQL